MDLEDSDKLLYENGRIDERSGSDQVALFDIEVEVTILDVYLEQDPPNTTYGHEFGGHLTPNGLVHEFKWAYNDYRIVIGGHTMAATRDAVEKGWTKGHHAHAVVTALVLTMRAAANAFDVDKVFGLLLLRVPAQHYRRVGTFRATESSGFWARHSVGGLDGGHPVCVQNKSEVCAEFLNHFERRTITIV
jgi:hypothetical protein